jgi:DNA-directed RNA polymerase alpha subunit
MKAELIITFNEAQIKDILNSLGIADCKRAIFFLQRRVQKEEEQKRQKKQGIRKWDDEFLNMRIEEFELNPWTLNRLRENELFTVRDVIDFGVENLAMLRGIGAKTTNEIKREIFNNPS